MNEPKLSESPCNNCPHETNCRHTKDCLPFRIWFSARWARATAALRARAEGGERR